VQNRKTCSFAVNENSQSSVWWKKQWCI